MNARQLRNIALRKCKVELEKIGVTFKEDLNWEFKITNRKTQFGDCEYKKKENKIIITLSKYMFENMNTDETNPINTTMHEMIHASGVWNHGREFKRIARLVNDKYGYNVKRVHKANFDDDAYKYIMVCKDCGQKIGRHKKSRFVKNYDKYSCGVCDGKFERIK